jgi:hypothetical protein
MGGCVGPGIPEKLDPGSEGEFTIAEKMCSIQITIEVERKAWIYGNPYMASDDPGRR